MNKDNHIVIMCEKKRIQYENYLVKNRGMKKREWKKQPTFDI